MYLRVCWNWQTGTFEGRVLHDVRVQVPSLAPIYPIPQMPDFGHLRVLSFYAGVLLPSNVHYLVHYGDELQ